MNMFNLFKKSKDESEKSVFSNKAVIALVVVAAMIMFFNSKLPDTEEAKNKEQTLVQEVENASYDVLNTEKRLEEILEKISGAGDVSVMIYYSNLGEKIIASDSRTRSEKENRGEGMESETEDREKSTVLYGGSGSEKPFITEERLPKPSGVLVIAEGAENEKVRYEISESVRALLGLAPNRIRVAAKNKANN